MIPYKAFGFPLKIHVLFASEVDVKHVVAKLANHNYPTLTLKLPPPTTSVRVSMTIICNPIDVKAR